MLVLFRSLVAASVLLLASNPALALITGGTGNAPMRDPGWPTGAAVIFNNPASVAHWEGPPFGGGQYHAEFRGDTDRFQDVLDDFAKLDVTNKRLFLHDGVGRSHWLNPNRKPEKKAQAQIDWVFMVWVTDRWKRFQGAPADLNPTNPKDAKRGVPSTIDLYTGGNVRFSELTIPKGITIVDNRMESHGFTPADGTVIEGTVTAIDTKKPISAKIKLEKITHLPKKGRTYSLISEVMADKQGHWVFKKVPAGGIRVVCEADGYAPRVLGQFSSGKQPKWHELNGELARATTVSGHVTDAAGKPLADVTVRLNSVAAGSSGSYRSPDGYTTQTDKEGGFLFDDVPIGRASIHVRKQGYCRPGLGPSIKVPAKDVSLEMIKAAQLIVTVEFKKEKPPKAYILDIKEDGEPGVGKWGGSALIDKQNQVTFKNIPPGRYFLQGHPNPTTEAQRTNPIVIDLSGGEVHRMHLIVP